MGEQMSVASCLGWVWPRWTDLDLAAKAWLFASALVVWRFLAALYIAHLGPLAHAQLPGPYLARWTSLPYFAAALSGKAMYYLHSQVTEYGPIVRIGPNEVAIGDPALARTVHAVGSGYLKAPFYGRLADERPPFWRKPMRYITAILPQAVIGTLGIDVRTSSDLNFFATNDLSLHGTRRRLYARPFSKQGILRWEAVLKLKTGLWIDRMRSESLQTGNNGKADIFKWLSLLTSDTIGELCFGQSLGGLEAGEVRPYMRDLQMILTISGVMAYMPSFAAFIANLPLPPLRKILSTGERLRVVGRSMIEDYLKREKQGVGSLESAGTIFDKAMTSVRSSLEEPTVDAEGHSVAEVSDSVAFREEDARTMLIGGTDTTATTLTYIIWSLIRLPAVRNKLLHELDEHAIDPQDVESLSLERLRNLPYLEAILQEGLRLYGAGSGNMPRSVPAGGKVLGGYSLPEGTVVNPQAYTLHRIASIFPEPETFKPERWLDATPEMGQAFLAWSHGARVCLGQHLARDEMLLGTVAFVGAFPHAVVAIETTDTSMEMEHYYGIAPKAHRCFISLGVKAA